MSGVIEKVTPRASTFRSTRSAATPLRSSSTMASFERGGPEGTLAAGAAAVETLGRTVVVRAEETAGRAAGAR
jgi:hypothetical protein